MRKVIVRLDNCRAPSRCAAAGAQIGTVSAWSNRMVSTGTASTAGGLHQGGIPNVPVSIVVTASVRCLVAVPQGTRLNGTRDASEACAPFPLELVGGRLDSHRDGLVSVDGAAAASAGLAGESPARTDAAGGLLALSGRDSRICCRLVGGIHPRPVTCRSARPVPRTAARSRAGSITEPRTLEFDPMRVWL